MKYIDAMKPKFFAHKNEYEHFSEQLRQAKKSMIKTVKYGEGLYASISALIKNTFPDLASFTSSHEDMLLDYICLSVCLSVCLRVCLSICLSVCLYVCMSVLCYFSYTSYIFILA